MENSVLPQIRALKAAFFPPKKKEKNQNQTTTKEIDSEGICFCKHHLLLSMENYFCELLNKMNGNTHQLWVFVALDLKKLLDFLFQMIHCKGIGSPGWLLINRFYKFGDKNL